MNAAVVLPQKNTNGIGFAFAVSEELLRNVKTLKAGEMVKHAYLGVSVSTAETPGGGAHIDSVQADGPCASADLINGDIVHQINSTPIGDSDTFARIVSSLPTDKSVTLRFERDGKSRTVEVTPRLRPGVRPPVGRANQRLYWAGMIISPATGGKGYAVQSIALGSPYVRQGVRDGSVITGVAGSRAKSLEELQLLLASTDSEIAKLDLADASPVRPVASTDVR